MAKPREFLLNLIVFHDTVCGNYIFEQQPKLGNIPLPIAQFIESLPLRILRLDSEFCIERATGCNHAKFFVEYKNRLSDGIDNSLSEGACISHRFKLMPKLGR